MSVNSRQAWLKLLESSLKEGCPPKNWNHRVERADTPPDLTGLDLSGANLTGWCFKGCELGESRFVGADLEGASFNNAVLLRCDFQHANLQGCAFVRARAEGADFRLAKVQEADFSWCDLRGAHLDGLDLATVVLWRTDLRGATYDAFTPLPVQQFIQDSSPEAPPEGVMLPVSRALQVLGAMAGTPHRWGGGASELELLVPHRVDKPESWIAQLLEKHRLTSRAVSDGGGRTQYVLVLPLPCPEPVPEEAPQR